MDKSFTVPRITGESDDKALQLLLSRVRQHLQAAEMTLKTQNGLCGSATFRVQSELVGLASAHSQQAIALMMYAAAASGD